jgi:hypothetical protein
MQQREKAFCSCCSWGEFAKNGMSSIRYLALWVGFLKQPALPGKAPQKNILQKKF